MKPHTEAGCSCSGIHYLVTLKRAIFLPEIFAPQNRKGDPIMYQPLPAGARRALRTLFPAIVCFSSLLWGPVVHAASALPDQTSYENLDEDATQWGIYQDGGTVYGTVGTTATPSLDGTALQASLQGGDPYTGLHVYRNLPPSSATSFTLSLAFRFTTIAAIQALEFTMNTWANDLRWEWAIQWEKTGDGTTRQGTPPAWRVWDGHLWQATPVSQQLTADTWHQLQLTGEIINGQVTYQSMQCDDVTLSLSQQYDPVVSGGQKLAVGVQLDGNYTQDPYQLSLDEVTLLTN